VIIQSRYNGPPGSGNGGYCAGVWATNCGLTADALEVTLRMPPPLEVENSNEKIKKYIVTKN
jgi:hypothetical protein